MSQFCYWQIYKEVDLFLLMVIGSGAFLILLYIIKQCFQMIKLFRHIDGKFILIYVLCLMWAILYVAKIAFLCLKYLTELKDADSGYDMFQISQMFCVIDTLPTFFLMYLLILIPYFWLKNITNFLQRMRRDQRKDKIILKLFTFYIYFRLVIFIGLFISEFTFTDQLIVDKLCDTLIIIILCEVFLSLSLLCYGLLKMFRNFSSLNVHDRKQKRKFIKEYLIMIVCSFIRFAMDFYFIIYEKTQLEEMNCLQYRKDNYVYTAFYIILGETFMHLAPILTILTIYKVDFKTVLEDSLIGDGKNKTVRKFSE